MVEHLTLNQGVLGSSPRWCTNGPLVKRLRLRPLTPATGVRFPHGSPKTCNRRPCSQRHRSIYINAYLAQSVEHAAVNRRVVGSSPTVGARKKLLEISQGVFLMIFALRQMMSVSPNELANIASFLAYTNTSYLRKQIYYMT